MEQTPEYQEERETFLVRQIHHTEEKFLRKGECALELTGDILENSGMDIDENYQSANSLTQSHPYFKVKLLELVGDEWIGIGLAPEGYDTTAFPGWFKGSIGWHFDNGGVYSESSSKDGKGTADAKQGDVVGCGYQTDIVQFDEKGLPKPGQTLTVNFTRNGCTVLKRSFDYKGGGLHACVAICRGSGQVQLLNHLQW